MSEQEKTKDGGPAYPSPPGHPETIDYDFDRGMSLRDWFAGQALAGIASRPFVPDRMDRGVYCIGTRPSDQAREAYAITDAMLAQRKGMNDER